MSKKKANGIVYSTNPDFQYQFNETTETETIDAKKQNLRVFRDSKGRGGKTVTIITGFVGSTEDMEKLGKSLKTYCGVGGSCKDGEILLQGDVREKACNYLEKNNYRFKRAGG